MINIALVLYLVTLESELKVKVIRPALTLPQHCSDWTETSFLIRITNQISCVGFKLDR